MIKRILSAGIILITAIVPISASWAFDASDAAGPSYTLQLVSPNTLISPNWFGERKLTDPTMPVVFKLKTKDDKNWVRLSSMTNWIIVTSYIRKRDANIPPACGNAPGVKSQANVFENLSARSATSTGEKTQEFTIVALIPPLPALSSPPSGCDQYIDTTVVGSVIGPASNYQVGSWISAPRGIGIVLIGIVTDEAGRTQIAEQTVSSDNSPYFELNMDLKTYSFYSKVWATGMTYTLPDQAKVNFARYAELKETFTRLVNELEILKNQSKTLPSDISEINTKQLRANSLNISITNEMAFQAFYIEPTGAKALQLPLLPRGTIVGEVDFDSLTAFKSDLEALKSRLTLQNTAKASPSASPNTISKSKLIVLSCVKGKVLKKVTGVNPKCPTGYKQVEKAFVM
jgi:hypothetical protein